MAVKKTATAKKKTGAAAKSKTAPKSTTAKRGPGRPKGSGTKTAAAKKSTPAKGKNVKNVKKPKARGGFNRTINDETGFVVGTDQDTIALELLKGGESRAEIAERLEKKIDPETRNGTPKQIKTMVSGVLAKMQDQGFTVEQSFVVNPPTPASKRAATRRKNSKK